MKTKEENENNKKWFDRGYRQAEKEALKRVVGLYGTPRCEHLHHNKKQQHGAGKICPVVKEINDLIS